MLLAQTEHGYFNLMHLVSQAWLETEAGDTPHVALAQLAAGERGPDRAERRPDGPARPRLPAGQAGRAGARLDALAPLFPGRLYIEMQRHGLESEQQVEPLLLDMAYRGDLPLVATNEPYFAERAGLRGP